MLRAIGPGSVSSVLKVGVDLIYVLLWVALVALILVFLGTLLAQPFIQGEPGEAFFSQFEAEAAAAATDDSQFTLNGSELSNRQVVALIRSAVFPVSCAVLAVYVGALVIITGRLRRIFVTLTRGDPFHPQNARRLQLIGLALAVLEGLNQLAPDLVFLLLPDGVGNKRVDLNFNFTAWFSIGVVLVLAEVFREGARLRREAELTI